MPAEDLSFREVGTGHLGLSVPQVTARHMGEIYVALFDAGNKGVVCVLSKLEEQP